jgi:fructose-1,6-bisphosphatase/inositol monophosphatase family enzyme
MTADPERVAALIRTVAAEEIVPRYRSLGAEDVYEKRPGSLVTAADLAAEARLADGLAAMVAGSRVVAEEMAHADPGILARLETDSPVWVIDPVDGTANFAAGRAPFAVIVAYVERGRTRAGWILDVLAGEMAVAEEGAGAFSDGTRLHAADGAPLAEMTGYVGARLRARPEVAAVLGPIRVSRCAGRDHFDLAQGVLHYALYRRAMPWDHAAGALIHREAGGYNAAVDGTPYSPAGTPEQGILLAPDRDAWEAVREAVLPPGP